VHHCPKCHQELNAFAFYCPRCKTPSGELSVKGDLLSVWWLDIDGSPEKEYAIKTVTKTGQSLNLQGVNPRRPDHRSNRVSFSANTLAGQSANFEKNVVDLFTALQDPSQEWEIE